MIPASVREHWAKSGGPASGDGVQRRRPQEPPHAFPNPPASGPVNARSSPTSGMPTPPPSSEGRRHPAPAHSNKSSSAPLPPMSQLGPRPLYVPAPPGAQFYTVGGRTAEPMVGGSQYPPPLPARVPSSGTGPRHPFPPPVHATSSPLLPTGAGGGDFPLPGVYYPPTPPTTARPPPPPRPQTEYDKVLAANAEFLQRIAQLTQERTAQQHERQRLEKERVADREGKWLAERERDRLKAELDALQGKLAATLESREREKAAILARATDWTKKVREQAAEAVKKVEGERDALAERVRVLELDSLAPALAEDPDLADLDLLYPDDLPAPGVKTEDLFIDPRLFLTSDLDADTEGDAGPASTIALNENSGLDAFESMFDTAPSTMYFTWEAPEAVLKPKSTEGQSTEDARPRKRRRRSEKAAEVSVADGEEAGDGDGDGEFSLGTPFPMPRIVAVNTMKARNNPLNWLMAVRSTTTSADGGPGG
ncbi:hypothetical protein MKEN_00021300 [Mycena kentingensis (nom. inval.)]|nr:hypothetical protein MKEN_00021300 [Mycena kentingensis (nom. inval.)]